VFLSVIRGSGDSTVRKSVFQALAANPDKLRSQNLMNAVTDSLLSDDSSANRATAAAVLGGAPEELRQEASTHLQAGFITEKDAAARKVMLVQLIRLDPENSPALAARLCDGDPVRSKELTAYLHDLENGFTSTLSTAPTRTGPGPAGAEEVAETTSQFSPIGKNL
jgi:hypothetical protein